MVSYVRTVEPVGPEMPAPVSASPLTALSVRVFDAPFRPTFPKLVDIGAPGVRKYSMKTPDPPSPAVKFAPFPPPPPPPPVFAEALLPAIIPLPPLPPRVVPPALPPFPDVPPDG